VNRFLRNSNGQVVLDEPLHLPDGTRLRIVPEEGDAQLEASLTRGIADLRAGRVTDLDEFMAEIEAEDRLESTPQ